MLAAAGERLRVRGRGRGQLVGLDIHEPSLQRARSVLEPLEVPFELQVQNFFDLPAAPRFDAVIGNPPYIRFQNFVGEDRLKAQRVALRHGVPLAGLASAWAAFVVHAAHFLKPEGRLGLILPAVLLSVNYAAAVRRFLLRRFKRVQVIVFEGRVFPGVMEEVVLLLAEGSGSTSNIELFQVKDASALRDLKLQPSASSQHWVAPQEGGKWTAALLPHEASASYTRLARHPDFTTLASWGRIDLGMVTGNNDFFTLTAAQVQELGLPQEEVLKISPPGSQHLRGLKFSEEAFDKLVQDGSRAFLFYPDVRRPSAGAQRYIARGEQLDVHEAYKCRVRHPWWRVPGGRVPDLFLTYMNQDTPRLITNEARAAHLNSIHGVTLWATLRTVGQELLPLAMLNSISLLGAELVGRSYGGGLLKLEPREADEWPMPSPGLLERLAPRLRALRPQMARHLRKRSLTEIVSAVDELLLTGELGVSSSHLEEIRAARQALGARRAARGRRPK